MYGAKGDWWYRTEAAENAPDADEEARAMREREAVKAEMRSRCIAAHLTKPWIPGFRRVLIRPLRRVPPEWLGPRHVAGPEFWHEPTEAFWDVHCRVSHPPPKECDVGIHTAYLTRTGKNAEFVYAHQLVSGEAVVEERADFERECAWFAREFPTWRPPAALAAAGTAVPAEAAYGAYSGYSRPSDGR